MSVVLKKVSKDVYLNEKKQSDNDDIFNIIKSLRPGCTFDATIGGGAINYHSFWDPNNLEPPTMEEVKEEIKYQQECKEYYQYAYDRCNEYPDGFEQFDMLWHAINDGTDLKNSEWFQTIKEIKEKYPKPNTEEPKRKE